MKNKKGMTLIEVILALFLLGLITVVFLPSTWASYKMMGRAKGLTVNIFSDQQKLEVKMQEARNQIQAYKKDNTKPNPMTKSITAFGKNIQGVPIVEGNLYTFIADKPIIDEGLPELEWVKLDQAGPLHWQGTDLTGSSKILDRSNYFMSLKKWYISKPGFDSYIPEPVVNESHWGTRYPSWPNDYELISNDRDKLSNLKDYVGRHVIYSVIPVSKTSQYGVEQPSKSVYIKGLPIERDLYVYLETHLLTQANGEILTKWFDLKNGKQAVQSQGDGLTLQYSNGKFLQFQNDSLVMEGMGQGNDELTLFVVFNNSSDNADKSQNIISREGLESGWKLGMVDGKLEFSAYTETNPISPPDPLEPAELPIPFKHQIRSIHPVDQDKHLVTAQISAAAIRMIIDKEAGSETIPPILHTDNVLANLIQTITIGDAQSEENIYEIIIYHSALSDEEINITRRYLSEKHRIR